MRLLRQKQSRQDQPITRCIPCGLRLHAPDFLPGGPYAPGCRATPTFAVKVMKYALLASGLVGLATVGGPLFGQNWTPPSTGTNLLWNPSACSADGTRLAAVVYGGGVYTSTDSGTNWIKTGAPDTGYVSVACSADGNKLFASSSRWDGTNFVPALLYISADAGATWTTNSATNFVGRLVCSADGTRLFANWPLTNKIYVSLDSGATWTSTSVSAPYGMSLACSADGNNLFAAVSGGPIFISTNAGSSWRVSGAPTNEGWTSMVSSADGSKLAAGAGVIYTSTDSGATWTSNNTPGTGSWSCLASSADGSKLAALGVSDLPTRPGLIFTSADSGATWTQADAPVLCWVSIASSADGCRLMAAAQYRVSSFFQYYYGGIYMSQSTPAPSLAIAPNGANLALSWIVPSMSFALEQSSDPTGTNWTRASPTPALNPSKLRYEVTLSPTNRQKFFRLASP
jgi:hypothetical protein